MQAQIQVGKVVLISDRYDGLVLEVVDSDVDQYGEFQTVDKDGQSRQRHVDDVDQVQ